MPLTILFGSESGNSESCAEAIARVASGMGFAARVVDMGDYKTAELSGERNLLLVVSTWGEGDPPERAVDFHGFMHSDKAPRLEGVRYSVCALGDTSYADFCACGIQFDKRLEALGARRIHPRVDCDVDYEGPFGEWMNGALQALRAASLEAAAAKSPHVTVVEHLPEGAVQGNPVVYNKKNPFPAPLVTKINMNGRGSAKETYHLEFSLAGSGMRYEPGDVVGIIPRNCPEVVDHLLELAQLRGDATVADDSGEVSLRECLIARHDVTTVNPLLVKKYAQVAHNPDLDVLIADENKEQLTHWLHGREVSDLLDAYPPKDPLPAEQFLALMRKMPPRLYSIASSLRAHPDEVHLTVGVVRYESHGRMRKGVCSTYLSERVEEGDFISLYTHANKNFFLPGDGDAPVIMVGPGTGIAPFRAFVEERAALGSKGRNWLFFGDQHFNSDFLYQLEWQQYLKSGVLNRMDVAFSRDTDRKIYVQHRMKEKAKDLYAWLMEGAYFYVCGDASRMAKDVHQALLEIFMEQGDMSLEAAEEHVKQMQKDKFYQRDVY